MLGWQRKCLCFGHKIGYCHPYQGWLGYFEEKYEVPTGI